MSVPRTATATSANDAQSLADWARRALAQWRRAEGAIAVQRMLPILAAIGAIGIAGGVSRGAATSLALGGTVLGAWWWARQRARAVTLAQELEDRVRASRNLLTTALPLTRIPPTSAAQQLVVQRAAALAASIELSTLFPIAPLRLLSASIVSAALLLIGPQFARQVASVVTAPVDRVVSSAGATSVPLRIDAVDVDIAPPSYLQRARETRRNVQQVEVPAGATLTVRVTADGADSVRLDSEAETSLTRDGAQFTVVRRADSSGVLAIVAFRGEQTARAFVGVQAQADADPRVRVIAPARDLVLPRGDTMLRVRIEADDDHALGALMLRYTKVSGSGERYAFVEGDVPLRVQRLSSTRWEATVDWSLAPLALAPGDVVVYRAVAQDRRPGAPLVESDAWLAELLSGRGDGGAGFAVDPGELRYALSQQMIVLRIERLIAARDSAARDPRRTPVDPETLVRQAENIAVEQRRVRAEFVFMMGGELAEDVSGGDVLGDLNEHQHAEADADLSAGRVRNEGRAAVFAAIRAMSRTTTALSDTVLPSALASAREAVGHLERAFSSARFLMRPLVEREAIDPTRRLSGSLLGVTGSTQPTLGVESDAEVSTWRRAQRALLEDAHTSRGRAASAKDAGAHAEQAARWQAIAGTLLRGDPRDAATQAMVLQLNAGAEALRQGDPRVAGRARDSVVTALTRRLASAASSASSTSRTVRGARLQSARPSAIAAPSATRRVTPR